MSKANTFEWQMLDLINAERAANGLNALQLELRLNDAAEDHSLWMINTDQFSHTGIGGSAPWDRMEDADFVFSGNWRAGENIAWQSVRGAPGLSDDVIDLHEGLMNSPGHRANILNPNFEVIGIGIERGDYEGWDGLFVTQNFARTAAPLELDSQTSPPADPEPPTVADATLQIGAQTVTQSSPDLWHKVAFDQTIADAVVVMGPVSGKGGDPLTVRVQNVTDAGFEFRFEEWEYLDGTHIPETVSWMAASAGTHEMADGRTIVAGTASGDHTAESVDFDHDFDTDPLVFAQVSSNRGGDTVTVRLDQVEEDGFQFRLQEEEALGTHVVEEVDWIAIEGGAFDEFSSGRAGGVTHQSSLIDHSADQALFAQMQTMNGTDTATVRYNALGNQSGIWVDEETSRDAETTHVNEVVAFVTADLGTYDLIA